MPEIRFYHLTRSAPHEALAPLLEKVLARQQRAVVLADGAERIAQLSHYLWTWRERSFLAHGSDADGMAAQQPIWLTTRAENPNGATILFLLDGLSPPPLADFSTVALVFDGRDPAATQAARARWAEWRGQYSLSYWQQEETGWVEAQRDPVPSG